MITVTVTANPLISASYDEYGDHTEDLLAEDIHGTADAGYHYRRVSVRQFAHGLGVKVSVVAASERVRVFSVSADVTPAPSYREV